jgi:hypothetical protein
MSKGFIDSTWNLLNWDKRQFITDRDISGAERQKRWRERQKEKNSNALRNVPVTLLDTDTDTDTDTDKKKKRIQGPAARVLPDWMPKEAWEGYVEMRKKIKKPLTDRAIGLKITALEKFRASGFDVSEILDQSTANDWTDIYEPKQKITVKSIHAKWATDAGFANVAEANNERCFERNAHQFKNGKRIEVAA